MKKVFNIFILTISTSFILFELYFLIIFGSLFLFNPQLSKIDQYRAYLINTTPQNKLNDIQNYSSFSSFLRADNFDLANFYFNKMDSTYISNKMFINDTILAKQNYMKNEKK